MSQQDKAMQRLSQIYTDLAQQIRILTSVSEKCNEALRKFTKAMEKK